MSSAENLRILAIDDQPSILEDYRSILAFESDPLADLENDLFGDDATPDPHALIQLPFELDCANQGEQGLALVERSISEDRPYTMAFVDMRMPPGWDGLRTVQEIWQADSRIQVVFCSAYSDQSWSQVIATLDRRDGLWLLAKPFDPPEVLQMARALTERWNRDHAHSRQA